MRLLGNILWLLCGGLINGLSWAFLGLVWSCTIIGIPIGRQCFKFASLSFCPFGKEIHYGGGAPSLLLNIIWMIITGIPMAMEHALMGISLCITIIGIPFGLQQFKLAQLALMPFGSEVAYAV